MELMLSMLLSVSRRTLMVEMVSIVLVGVVTLWVVAAIIDPPEDE